MSIKKEIASYKEQIKLSKAEIDQMIRQEEKMKDLSYEKIVEMLTKNNTEIDNRRRNGYKDKTYQAKSDYEDIVEILTRNRYLINLKKNLKD
jgi:hypothetical protein